MIDNWQARCSAARLLEDQHMNATYRLPEARDDDSDDVSGIVGKLQRIADSQGAVHLAAQTNRRLRILFVVGSSLPWRAIEYDREVTRKRMMCFRDPKQLQRFALARFECERAQEKFVREHLVTPGGLPGITTDWLPSHCFDAALEAYREEIGGRPDQTLADRIVTLPHLLRISP
jgi:hypothetical protein